MAQVKKPAVREAILRAAEKLFTEKGYHEATLPQIAREAGVSPGTVYVYFGSKIEIVYTIYDPWLRAHLEDLSGASGRVADLRARLRLIVSTIWQQLPQRDGGFAKVLIQSLSAATPESGYDPGLLHWSEGAVATMLLEACAGRMARDRAFLLAHMLFMSFDGFALNARINPASGCSDALVDCFVEMMIAGLEDSAKTKPKNE